jgi:hypothetical protein
MSALMRWNVRIIDYLMERKVNPNVKDSFGFTASQKAQIKNLRNIHSMLKNYEVTHAAAMMQQNLETSSPITNARWKKILEEKKLDPKTYQKVPLLQRDSHLKWKPSDML